MPSPKDPIKYQEWKNKLSLIAKSKGFGKWMKGRHNSLNTEFKKGTKVRVGTKHTKDVREKMSNSHKGINVWNKGRKIKKFRAKIIGIGRKE